MPELTGETHACTTFVTQIDRGPNDGLWIASCTNCGILVACPPQRSKKDAESQAESHARLVSFETAVRMMGRALSKALGNSIEPHMVPLEYLRAAPWAKPPYPPLVQTIAEKFDPRLFGVLTVSKRSETEVIVIDGMVRWEALVRLRAREAPCVVLSGLTPKREAEIRMELILPARIEPSPREAT